MAQKVNITIDQGTTFNTVFTIHDAIDDLFRLAASYK